VFVKPRIVTDLIYLSAFERIEILAQVLQIYEAKPWTEPHIRLSCFFRALIVSWFMKDKRYEVLGGWSQVTHNVKAYRGVGACTQFIALHLAFYLLFFQAFILFHNLHFVKSMLVPKEALRDCFETAHDPKLCLVCDQSLTLPCNRFNDVYLLDHKQVDALLVATDCVVVRGLLCFTFLAVIIWSLRIISF